MPQLEIGDTIYDIDAAYRAGARAARMGRSCHSNPHRNGSQAFAQWESGLCHEEAGEHIRFGRDVVAGDGRLRGVIREDPAVPRDAHGQVDQDWYEAQLRRFESTPGVHRPASSPKAAPRPASLHAWLG